MYPCFLISNFSSRSRLEKKTRVSPNITIFLRNTLKFVSLALKNLLPPIFRLWNLKIFELDAEIKAFKNDTFDKQIQLRRLELQKMD